MLPAREPFVEARKLVADVVNLMLAERAILQVEIPSPRQRRISAKRVTGHVERRHPASIDDKRTVLLVRIQKMKNEERFVLEPFHFAALAIHRADLGPMLRLPSDERLSLRRVLDMEHRRTDKKDRVVFGRDKIMHHRWQSGIDSARLDQLSIAAGAIPRHIWRKRLVAKKQQVARDRIQL